MTHASLFSGIGGFDLAAQWAGFENLFNCEIDPFCQRILNYHFPDAKQHSDIKTTDFTPWRGKVDILTGGFPCQPFSLAGQRKGTDDDRYLWPEMLRVISEIRPTWVIGENVGGIVSMVQPGYEVEVAAQASLFGEDHYTTQERQGFIIERICRDIENLGYCVQPILIPACGVGAPHRRDRVWFVAENTKRIRCDGGQSEEEPRAGGFGEFGTGDHVRVCRETRIVAHRTDTGIEAMRGRENGISSAGIVADGSVERREPRSCEVDKRQECTSNGRGIQPTVNRPCGGGAIAYTPSLRHQKRHAIRAPAECAEIVGFDRFPTQSPVCSRDDGVSGELDSLTFSKWRMQSIKGYGNAIVPQIALQIMEAIKEVEQKQDKT